MRTAPVLRKKQTSVKYILQGGLSGIMAGLFGSGSPAPALAEQASVRGGPLYRFHQGDLFLPWTGNFVLEPPWETPVVTTWGNGSLVHRPNIMAPIGGPGRRYFIGHPAVTTVGLGGVIHGQIIFQPIEVRPDTAANG